VLEYAGVKSRVGGPPSRPRFASRRDPITSFTGSSSKKNAGALRVLHRMLRGRRRWYVQLVVVGEPPVRPQLRAAVAARPASAVGVDVGSRHIAAVGVAAATSQTSRRP
jgi:hypothetical protein